jgi:plastocyanin
MKKFSSLFFILFITLFLTGFAYSATWVVQVSNFSFIPANLNVSVGDSIKWQWLNGDHTTTSSNIPAGAAAWNSLITGTNQIFIYVVAVPGDYQYVCTPHAPQMAGTFTANPIGIKSEGNNVPEDFRIFQNYPNPFNPVTNIKFDIPKSTFVELTVYNLLGSKVEVLVNRVLESGNYTVDWDASKYSSGIYFYKLSADNFVQTRKMTLIK